MIERHVSGSLVPAPLRGRSRSRPTGGRCGTPGCERESGHGTTKRFCAEHAAELEAVRERMSAGSRYKLRSDQRKIGKRGSTCCAPGCMEPRIPPAAFCDECVAAGFVEEEDV